MSDWWGLLMKWRKLMLVRGEVIDSINNWWVDSSCSWAAHHSTTAGKNRPAARNYERAVSSEHGSWRRHKTFPSKQLDWGCLWPPITLGAVFSDLFCFVETCKGPYITANGRMQCTHSCSAFPASSSSKKNRKVLCAPVHYINFKLSGQQPHVRGDTWHVVTSGDRRAPASPSLCSYTLVK